MKLLFFNSLTRKKEIFKAIRPPKVGVYTCGPTVYSYVSIGNWKTYVLGDLVVRTLKYLGFEPTYIMNITDVGHLTGDNLGDADLGEDRMERAAKKEKKTAWDIAKFYSTDFKKGYSQLNLVKPKKFTKATDYIKEQISLVKRIEEKGFTYLTSDGVYFDVKKWEKAGYKYGRLSSLDKIKAGVRVKKNLEKKDLRDFALWKFSPKGKKRHMEWDSPWAPPGALGKVKGFPGWHIECSAMSMKYLGERFDIHIGGEDLKSTHHPNEIAQSEAATGKKPFVKYWIHGAFLLVNGGRMGKSLGNVYTLHDILEKGLNPMSLRYFYLTGHYRKQLNFTWKGLRSASLAYQRLRKMVNTKGKSKPLISNNKKVVEFKNKFIKAVADDLNMPQALAVVWQVVKSGISDKDKQALVLDFDKVLGLGLEKASKASSKSKASKEVLKLVEKRGDLRKQKKWQKADKIRKEIEKKGYLIEDTSKGPKLALKNNHAGK